MNNRKYRLYIDESGTHKYSNSISIKERYLCLLGVIISAEDNQRKVSPKWEELRSIFMQDVDFPPFFHYVDVISKKNGFSKLFNREIQDRFNTKYIELLKNSEYILCCVVLDKKSHNERYGASAMHPYHYCINVLLERYVKFLSSKNASGDVLAEARGKREDILLRSEFSRFYENGTSFLRGDVVQKRLTSNQLKLKTKEARICGLEMADMLATPMKYFTLKEYEAWNNLDDNFTKTVLETVICKVRKNPFDNSIKGFGIKLIK